MSKKLFMFIGAACLLLLTACARDKNILEEVGYIRTAGYDTDPENANRVKITFLVPLLLNQENKTSQRDEILTAVTGTGKEARVILSRRTSKKLVSGQLRTILFSEDFARQGLLKHLDTFMRDSTISKRAGMVIVEGSANEIISSEYPGHPPAGKYIDQLLTKEFESESTPRVLLHQFIRDYYEEGKDPIITIMRKNGQNLETNGVALFQKDKYVGKVLPEELFYFSIMYHNLEKGVFTITSDMPELETVTFDAINSHKKIKIKQAESGKLRAEISLNVDGGVREYIGNLKLSTPERAAFEKILGEYVSRRADQVVRKLQQHHTDPLGIGQYVRNKVGYENWKQTDWRDMYADMEIEVNAKFLVKNFGSYYD